VTIIIALPTVALSPVLGTLIIVIGALYYMYASMYVPKPVFWDIIRKDPKSPMVNLAVDEYGLPLMVPVSVLRTHCLLVAATGSGKTTKIRTIAESVMKLGGGFCFIDGKADVNDTYKILYEIVTNTDREEDLLVLNFLNPMQSHTFNVLLKGEPDFLSEVMAGFLQDVQGDQSYWQGKAKELMKVILTPLVYMRDHKDKYPGFKISIAKVKEYLNLAKLVALLDDPNLPDYDDKHFPIKKRLENFLGSLAPLEHLKTINSPKPSPSVPEAIRQFGFYTQQWGEPIDLVSAAFGNIFNAEDPDVDIEDVVINSRILIVLLPSLSYSPGTLRSLGRVVLSTFRVALTTALGKEIEGEAKELERKTKINRPSVPFMLIADEYGAYAVDGMDTLLAQARSLGMSIMISVQEIASLMKASEVEAKRMLANTVTKFFMRVVDSETADYVAKLAGEEMYMTPSGSSAKGEIGSISPDGTYQYQKHARINGRDLSPLKVGEGYIIYGDEVRKYTTRYIPEKGNVAQLRLMKYIKKAIHRLQEFITEATEKTMAVASKIMLDTYALMKDYAIGPKEERLWKRFLTARNDYFEETMEFPVLDYSDINTVTVFVAELRNRGFLDVKNEDEYSDIKQVVAKRIKFRELQEQIHNEMMKEMDDLDQSKPIDDIKMKNFWNRVFMPSKEANEFLEKTATELSAVRKAQFKSSVSVL
jgi:intracellular multiplication protein IcmO